MKHRMIGFAGFMLICSFTMAQSPFGLSQKWFFSKNSGLNFTNGAGALVNGAFLAGGQVNGLAQEASSTITDTSGNVIFYSDSYRIYNGAHATVTTGLRGGTSSTNGNAIVPLPGSTTRYILVTGNTDPGGGGDKGATLGVNYYVVDQAGPTVTVGAANLLLAADVNTEQLCIAPNGNGTGYWIIVYNRNDASYKMWPITSAGVGAMISQTPPVQNWSAQYQGTIKVSRCLTRIISVTWDGKILSYDWNPTTGAIGTNRINYQLAGVELYGAEISPDGTVVYASSLADPPNSQASRIYQVVTTATATAPTVNTLATGPATSPGNPPSYEFGTMQLGPDGRIYVARATDNATPAYVSVIGTPNGTTTGTCGWSETGITIPGGANAYRGMANQPLLNPFLSITHSTNADPNCNVVNFSRPFRNYNRQEVGTVANSEEWEFYAGQGYQTGKGKIPSHTYDTEGLKTIRLKVTDNTCSRVWEATTTLTITCPLPVTWLNFEAIHQGEQVTLYWATAMEKNNDRFEVMRSSDGIAFTAIGSIKGTGNSTEINNYQFVDPSPLNGIAYYKLVQRDFDGMFSSSEIRQSGERSNSTLLVSPNPSSTQYSLLISRPSQLVLTDALGRLVYEANVSDDGVHMFGQDLPIGNYILKIITADHVQVEQLVKQ